MSNLANKVTTLSDTLTLCECTSPHKGDFGFWLYDDTRGMNLSMRAKTANAAFVEALTYYQKRLEMVEQENMKMKNAIDSFIKQFSTDQENEEENQ